MKISIVTLIASSAFVHADSYVSEIIQTNTFKNEAGIIQPPTTSKLSDITNRGNGLAKESIMGNTTFDLITTNSDTGETFLLDTASVSSYLADATIQITGPTEDPYNSNPNNRPNFIQRTRADKPFCLVYTITDLLPATSGTPEAASSLLMERSSFSSKYASDGTKTIKLQDSTDINLTSNGHFEKTTDNQITGPDLTKVCGEEVFTIYMKPDDEVKEHKEIDSGKIIILPVPSCEMDGLKNNTQYSNIPPITLKLTDLYPDSDTYLSITGSKLQKPIIHGGKKNTLSYPVSDEYTIDLNEKLVDDGTYTVKLLHESCYGIEEYDSVTIIVKRVISIKGSVISSE